MQPIRRVVGSDSVNEAWGPALREFGLEFQTSDDWHQLVQSPPDCVLIDARNKDWSRSLSEISALFKGPIVPLVAQDTGQDFLRTLRDQGTHGYVSEHLPGEELALRLQAMLKEDSSKTQESRGAPRIWFQELVEFTIFKQAYKAWSTTLSETGIFLHTSLSFPLYSTILIKFQIPGETVALQCEGVIVRQEVEGEICGFGVMFQNLKGEAVHRLESFLEIYR